LVGNSETALRYTTDDKSNIALVISGKVWINLPQIGSVKSRCLSVVKNWRKYVLIKETPRGSGRSISLATYK
jgi:hypothetical protein